MKSFPREILNRIPLCLLVGLLAVFLLQVRPFSPAVPFRLEVPLRSDAEGRALLRWTTVRSEASRYSDSAQVSKGGQVLTFFLPDTTLVAFGRNGGNPRDWLQNFGLNPLDHAGRVVVGEMRIVGPAGETVATIPTSKVLPVNTDAALERAGGTLALSTGGNEGLFHVFEQPLELKRRTMAIEPVSAALQFVCASAAILFALLFARRAPGRVRARVAGVMAKWRDGIAAKPRAAVFAAAALATALSCHPLLFFGKSLVSPNNGVTNLYEDFPTVPEAAHETVEEARGSDLGATAWAHLPYSVAQHRAIFGHGELPLWNRYTYCGGPLLGQGQSMLGDPLHWIPIAAGGAAWAWDVKFCLAKLLFSFGAGLLAFHATRRVWVAALIALSSSFIGFFAFRFNHCAFFSLCYAPWVLLCWLRAAQSQARVWPWALALAAANFWELNSGTAKEATMLIAGLNFTGALLVLLAEREWRERVRRLALMALGLVIFVLLSAPHWMLFLDALKQAWTVSASAAVVQHHPSLLLGIFDDLFSSQTTASESLLNPSANFLVLLGCLWAAVNVRGLLRERVFVAVLPGAALAAAMIFGVVPPGFIMRLPLIANISHVGNTFICVLIIHLFVIAAFGLRSLWDRAVQQRVRGDAMMVGLLLLLLAALYFGHFQSGRLGKTSGFFRAYAAALGVAVLALPWIVRQWRLRPSAEPLVLGALCLFLIHFRHGFWAGTKFDWYVINPRARAELAAPSPAVREVAASLARGGEPQRVAGLGGVLVAGFNTVPGLEHFNGADAVVSRWQRELIEKSGLPIQWTWRSLMLRDDFPRAKAFGDLWNVGWYLGTPSELPRKVNGLVHSATLDLDIYRSPTVWPRAFFTDRLVECSSLDNFVHLIGAADGKPFAASVPETSSVVTGLPVGSGEAAASLAALEGRTVVQAGAYRVTENTTAFTVDAPASGVVVLGDSYEQGNWRVTLDGKPAEYFRVNHAFLGVRIPAAGTHILHFKYWPRLLTPALWAALSGLLLAAATAAVGLRTRSARQGGVAGAASPDAVASAAVRAAQN